MTELAIDKEQSSKEVTSWVDHRVSLVCSVRAAPDASPAFSWHRKRDPTSVINAKQNDEWARSVLTILTIKADDFDSYVCTARTTQSTVTLEIPIKRLGKLALHPFLIQSASTDSAIFFLLRGRCEFNIVPGNCQSTLRKKY